jgi:hypothetical protein
MLPHVYLLIYTLKTIELDSKVGVKIFKIGVSLDLQELNRIRPI